MFATALLESSSLKEKEVEINTTQVHVRYNSENEDTLGFMNANTMRMYVNESTTTAAKANIPAYEFQALKDLYYSTNGDEWNVPDRAVKWHFEELGHVANPCSEKWIGTYLYSTYYVLLI